MSSCQGRTTLGFYVKESVLKHLAYLFESVFRYIKVGFYRRIFLWVLWIFLTSFSKQHLMNSCLCLSLGVSLKYLHLINQSKKTELIHFLDLWRQMHVRHFSLILLRVLILKCLALRQFLLYTKAFWEIFSELFQ